MVPQDEKAVENDAGPPEYDVLSDESDVGIESWASGEKVMRAPPLRAWRYTYGESPTESNVLPSGDIDEWLTGASSLSMPLCVSLEEDEFPRTLTSKNFIVGCFSDVIGNVHRKGHTLQV